MPVTTTIPQPKPLPEKAEWPLGTYKAGFVTFDDFAKDDLKCINNALHLFRNIMIVKK